MTTTACKHDLEFENCFPCSQGVLLMPEPPYVKRYEAKTRAQFEQRCPGCGEDIDLGDSIYLHITGVWVDAGCRNRDL